MDGENVLTIKHNVQSMQNEYLRIFLIIVVIVLFYILAFWFDGTPYRTRQKHDKRRQKIGPAPVFHSDEHIADHSGSSRSPLNDGFKNDLKRRQ